MRDFSYARARAFGAALLCGLLAGPAPVRADDDGDGDKPAAVHAAAPAPPSKDAAKGPGVNINSAALSELLLLPGIGERKAEGIINRREKKKFTRAEELMEVKGIGRGIFKRCKPYVRINGPTTLTAKVVGDGTRKG